MQRERTGWGGGLEMMTEKENMNMKEHELKAPRRFSLSYTHQEKWISENVPENPVQYK